ncbi:uncharacterized protein LOC130727748 [Lotus japonicus]|uniref:uncharacterized protein LOC130727748 n=1 Tax=Lotus japonicus TaxID=34305 RepID=UPI00258B4DD6|nr:uncharacterized protein LOC130727748 [Lotus japonicus]
MFFSIIIIHPILPLLFSFFQCTILKICKPHFILLFVVDCGEEARVLSPNRPVSRKSSEKKENGEGQDRSLQLWSGKGKDISYVVQLLLKRIKRGEEKEEEEEEEEEENVDSEKQDNNSVANDFSLFLQLS